MQDAAPTEFSTGFQPDAQAGGVPFSITGLPEKPSGVGATPPPTTNTQPVGSTEGQLPSTNSTAQPTSQEQVPQVQGTPAQEGPPPINFPATTSEVAQTQGQSPVPGVATQEPQATDVNEPNIDQIPNGQVQKNLDPSMTLGATGTPGTAPQNSVVAGVASPPEQPPLETFSSTTNNLPKGPNLSALKEPVSEQLRNQEGSPTTITSTFQKLNEMLQGASGNPQLEALILKAAQSIVDGVAQNQKIPAGSVQIDSAGAEEKQAA